MSDSDENICEICCEEFNQSTRARVDCPSCHYPACRTCVRTYLLGTNDDPHCLKCKNRWERDMLIKATLKSFVNKEYKEHRKNTLFEHEKSRLAATMPAVENHKKCLELESKSTDLQDKINELRRQTSLLRSQQGQLQSELWRRKQGGGAKEKKKFMKACPAEGCRGFLSTQWKCGLCNVHVCSKCFVIKAKDEEGNFLEHVCNEDDVKSAEMIKKETRNCPKCAVPIFKTEGCDQMWCTECHTAFSWRTGLVVTGVVHNPHFYAWQNSGAAAARANVPGAIMCGGIPQLYSYRELVLWGLDAKNAFRRRYDNSIEYTENEILARTTVGLHRACNHFANVELDRVRRTCNRVTDNEELRIKYILNEITEETMKREIIRRDKKRSKALAMLQIYELVNTVFTESIRDIFAVLSEKRAQRSRFHGDESVNELIERNLQRCEALRDYANGELSKISVIYSQCVAYIERNFMTSSRKYKKSDLIS